jgi:predicted DNA-binding mobile mystery protein A
MKSKQQMDGRMQTTVRKSFKQLKLRQLDATLKQLQLLRTITPPRSGWLRELRKGLGLTTAQMAQRLGITKQRVGVLERAEADGKLTLASLKRAAAALGCELVYAVVPKGSLEEMIDRQAELLANEMVRRTAHSMWLERQSPSEEELAAQTKDLVEKLKADWHSRYWNMHSRAT